jgi:thiamine-phosphate pyrophosphorylase
MERAVAAALAGGVNVVQLREKSLGARELYELGYRLRKLTDDAGAALLVNDRADVAVAVGADGVHLGGASLPISVASGIVGSRLVGRSVHSVAEAVEAEHAGADYIVLGTIFHSQSHPNLTPHGPHLIRKVKPLIRVPLIAIGGISAENAAQTIADGADGVAVVRSILSDEHPEQAARRLVDRIHEAWPSAILHRDRDRGA